MASQNQGVKPDASIMPMAGKVIMEDTIQTVTSLFAQQNLHDVPAARLNQIPATDREESLYDVHGVLTEPVVESPELIQAKLDELASRLCATDLASSASASSHREDSKIRILQKSYQQVAQNCTDHLRRIMISCLRTERFNTEKAAIRVLKHLDMRLSAFGSDSLEKELGINDLNEIERQALDDGAVQLLQKKDRTGRAIIFQFGPKGRFYPIEVVVKLLFWSGVMAARDEEVQKAGIVYIFYVSCWKGHHEADARGRQIAAIGSALPARVAAGHICTNDLRFVDTCSLANADYVESQFLCRFRSHYGTRLAIQNNLMTFGIPVDALPLVDDDFNLDLRYHREWIERLVEEESRKDSYANSKSVSKATKSAFAVETPGAGDIILGRGPQWASRPLTYHREWIGCVVEEEESKEYYTHSKSLNDSTKSAFDVETFSECDNILARGRLVEEEEGKDSYANSKSLSEATKSAFAVETPCAGDIILGRGSSWTNHPGNRHLRRILEERRVEFDIGSRKEKSALIQAVFLDLRVKGTRFLFLDADAGSWCEVSKEKALDRIGHGFRNLRLTT